MKIKALPAMTAALLLHLLAPPGFADEASEVPSDGRAEWAYGFARFDTDSLDASRAYLGASIPLYLRDRLDTIKDRELPRVERLAIAERVLRQQLVDLGRQLDVLIERRSDLLFSSESSSSVERDSSELSEGIRSVRARMEALSGLETEDVRVPTRKPVRLERGEEELFEAQALFPARLARELDLDLLITGTIEERGEFLFIELRGISRWTEESLFRLSHTAGADRVFSSLSSLETRLTEELLGRPFSRLRIEAPEDALVMVNGEPIGSGTVESGFLEPGGYEVLVTRLGYQAQRREITLGASEIVELSVEPAPLDAPSTLVSTSPPGANVYLDSVWQGSSPVSLPPSDQTRHLRIELADYRSVDIPYSRDLGDRLDIRLNRDIIDWELAVDDRKDAFYRGLGAFVLSVPIPLIFNGLYENIAGRLSREPAGDDPILRVPADERNALATTGNIFYYSYLGGIVISGGLFVNAVAQLVEYIRAGEAFHPRIPPRNEE
jgi:hypothetical protein